MPDDPIRDTIPPALALAFAPLHKRAFGFALGSAVGVAFAGATVIALLRGRGDEALSLLVHYFAGYEVSWSGALVGLAWGFVVGFVGGWFIAFVRNLAIAVSIFVMRTRAELAQSRDFLDHI